MLDILYQVCLLFFVFEAEVMGVWICDILSMEGGVPVFHILKLMVIPYWNLKKNNIGSNCFQNGFRQALFQQLRDDFKFAVMLTKYPLADSSSRQKGPTLVSKKKAKCCHLSTSLIFLLLKLDCDILMEQRRKLESSDSVKVKMLIRMPKSISFFQ